MAYKSVYRSLLVSGECDWFDITERKTHMLEYDQLKEMVAAMEDDVVKAEGGNKAAGTRVRKTMQDIKQTAQSIRMKILEQRSGD